MAAKAVVTGRVYTGHLPPWNADDPVVALQTQSLCHVLGFIYLFVFVIFSFVVIVGAFCFIFNFSFVCIMASHRARTLSVSQTCVIFITRNA